MPSERKALGSLINKEEEAQTMERHEQRSQTCVKRQLCGKLAYTTAATLADRA